MAGVLDNMSVCLRSSCGVADAIAEALWCSKQRVYCNSLLCSACCGCCYVCGCLQTRRHLHTFKPSQLAAVLCAIAAYPPGEGAPASTSGWHPGRLFLFDFISHSSPAAVMQAWTGQQAAQVLWAFSRFR